MSKKVKFLVFSLGLVLLTGCSQTAQELLSRVDTTTTTSTIENTTSTSTTNTSLPTSSTSTTSSSTVSSTPTTTTTSTTITLENIPPEVTATYPADGTTGVATNTAISATFSEDLDISTVNNSTFIVSSVLGQVTGLVSYDASSKKTIFTPGADLAFNKTYIASVSASVKDAAGNAQGTDYTWSFATRVAVAWTKIEDGWQNQDDAALEVYLDSGGNVHVCGAAHNQPNRGFDMWGTKFNSSGLQGTSFGAVNDSDDAVYGIAVDSSENLYFAGYKSIAGHGYDVWIEKWDSNYDTVWSRSYNGSFNGDDACNGMTVDSNWNVYLIGYESIGPQDTDIWIRKYDSNGNILWTRTYGGSGFDAGYDIAVDSGGNVYATGAEAVSGQGYNVWVKKYDNNGNVLWTQTYNGPSNLNDEGLGIAVDGNGNIYVVGDEGIDGEGYNVWIRKYDNNGNTVWTRTYNGVSNQNDVANDVAIDNDGNIYVTGYIYVAGQWDNIWIRKYDSSGNILWTETYNGDASRNDVAYGIAVDNSGGVYVVGYETTSSEGANFWVRKYQQ